MRRASLVSFLLAASSIACASRPVTILGTSLTLDPKMPMTEIAFDPAQLGATAEVLILRIVSISGDGQSFSVHAYFVCDGDVGASCDLGSVAPFPSTLPSSFVLSIKPDVRARAAAAAHPGLVVELAAIAPDRPLHDPLEVEIAPPIIESAPN